MARLALAFGVVGALVAAAWAPVERGGPQNGEIVAAVAAALVPALVLALVRGRWGARSYGPWRERAVVGLVLLAATAVAASAAFDVSLADARPGGRGFFSQLLSDFGNGFLAFYDTKIPFSRIDYPLMHGVVLLAIFGFAAVAGLAIAARRPIGAAAITLVGVAWPLTLIPPEHPLRDGALALAGLLAVLFLVRRDERPVRGLPQAVAAGLVLVLVSVAASSSSAVAKQEFLHWETWDFYNRPDRPVALGYIWDSNYSGIHFPRKKTEVLRIHVDGPRRQLYWRATVLDEYTGFAWRDTASLGPVERSDEITSELADPLLPRVAKKPANWIKQDVDVGAISDNHLIASAQPVKWRPGTSNEVRIGESGIAVVSPRIHPGQRYTAWSYVPDEKPQALAQAPQIYPEAVDPDLELLPLVPLPAFGVPNRDAKMRRLFAAAGTAEPISPYAAIYRKARRVVGDASSPYTAAVLLEAWFREGKTFRYTEQPGPSGFEPPLVDFILRTHRGYCQHFAGAMALMLRLLGVPARVAAGFTTGEWDPKEHEWVVTDHNAHTWVEVYFPGYGWIPFDPTPGRGQLSGSYTTASPNSDKDALAQLVGRLKGEGVGAVEALRTKRAEVGPQPGPRGPQSGVKGTGAGGSGSALRSGGTSLFKFLLLVVAVAVAGLALLKLVRRRVRFLARDPRALAAACRRDLVGFLADQDLAPPASATPVELAEHVERQFVVDATPFARALAAARFGPPAHALDAVRRSRRELRQLEKEMRSQLGFARRARGLVSLRSLTQ